MGEKATMVAKSIGLQPGPHDLGRWLLLVPFVWQLAMVPALNGVRWTPWGLPFLLVWELLGVGVCTAVLHWVFVLDRNAGLEQEEAEFLRRTATPRQPGAGGSK